MRKSAILLTFLLIIFLKPHTLKASEIPPNLEEMTGFAQIVVIVRCESESEGEIDIKGRTRGVVENLVMVEKVIKNDTSRGFKAGEKATFQTFTPAKLAVGGKYLIFMKEYPSGVLGFVGGDRGVFKIEAGADGRSMIKNKFDNDGLMLRMKEGVTVEKTEGLGIKAVQKEGVSNHVRGPIELNGVVEIVDRIKNIKNQQETPVKKLEGEKVLEKAK